MPVVFSAEGLSLTLGSGLIFFNMSLTDMYSCSQSSGLGEGGRGVESGCRGLLVFRVLFMLSRKLLWLVLCQRACEIPPLLYSALEFARIYLAVSLL